MACAAETAGRPLFGREQWRDHPRYPAQLLLVRSHAGFRAVSRHLVELAGAHERWAADCRALFEAWQGSMRAHEGYEELKLYPYLACRYGVTLGALAEDHVRMHGLEREVRRALGGGAADATAALARYDEELVAHLAREEDIVIPMLLELPADEFLRYTMLPAPYRCDAATCG
jgi:hypothetical protein